VSRPILSIVPASIEPMAASMEPVVVTVPIALQVL
jgi:hypothetical protein